MDETGEMASFNVNSEDDLAVVVDVSLENALDLGRYTDAPNRDAVVVAVVAAFSFVLVILMLARVQDARLRSRDYYYRTWRALVNDAIQSTVSHN